MASRFALLMMVLFVGLWASWGVIGSPSNLVAAAHEPSRLAEEPWPISKPEHEFLGGLESTLREELGRAQMELGLPRLIELTELGQALSAENVRVFAGAPIRSEGIELLELYLARFHPRSVVWSHSFDATSIDPDEIVAYLLRDWSVTHDPDATHYGLAASLSTDRTQVLLSIATARAIPRLYLVPIPREPWTPRTIDPSTVVAGDREAVDDLAAAMAQIEALIFTMTNEYRTSIGLPALRPSLLLDEAARLHSTDMAARNYYDHVTPEGRGLFERIEALEGAPALRGAAENINFYQRFGDLIREDVVAVARSMVHGWIHSEGHRLNIVNPHLTHLGVGLAIDVDRDVAHGTQKFARFGDD